MADIQEIQKYIEKLTKKEEQGEDVQELWQLMNSDFEKFKENFFKKFPSEREEIKEKESAMPKEEIKKEEVKELRKEFGTQREIKEREEVKPKEEVKELRKEVKSDVEDIRKEFKKEKVVKEEIADLRKEFGKEKEIKKDEEPKFKKEEIKEESKKEIRKEEVKPKPKEEKIETKKEIPKEKIEVKEEKIKVISEKPKEEKKEEIEIKVKSEKEEKKPECIEDEITIKVGKEKYEVEKIWKEEKKEEKPKEKKVKEEIETKELIGLLIALLGVVGIICTIIYKVLYGFSFGIRTQSAFAISVAFLIGGIAIQMKNKAVFKKDFVKSFAFQKIVAIIVALLLIFTSVVLTNYYLMNVEPTPVIEIKYKGSEVNEVMAGEVLIFNAGKSSDKDGYLIEFKGEIVNYTWDFGDGTKGYEKTIEHYYLEDGIKTVKLTVRDNKGVEKSAKKDIKITQLILTVPNKKIGDIGNYGVSGKVDVKNYETGLATQEIDTGTITIKEISLNLGGTLDLNVKGYANKVDGFNNIHNTLEILTTQKVNFNGISTADFKSNSLFPPSQNNMSIQTSGYSNVDDKGYLDLYNNDLYDNKTIQKNTNSNLSITFSYNPLPSFTIKSSDEIVSYNDLSATGQFNFEEIYKERKLGKGIEYDIDKKGTTYNCSVQNVEKVKVGNDEITTLKIKMTLDDDTMQRRGFTDYFAEFWVSKEFSYPLKVRVSANGKDPNTNAEFSIDITVSAKSFTNGNQNINYVCNSQHNISKRENADFKNWNFSPEGKGSFNFSSKDAIEMALNESNNATVNFRNYVSNETRNDSYVVFANYTEEDNNQTWNFTFGMKENTMIYNLTVVREGDNFTFYDKGEGEMNSMSNIPFVQSKTLFYPKNSKDELGFNGKILTIESFEDILKNDTKAKTVFTDGKIDYSQYFFEIKVDFPYSNIDINALFSEGDISDYSYVLRSKDGKLTISVDAENGQLMFIVNHQ